MRLWRLHPNYLDTKGLVALWREALLAKRVLQGRTKGYRHHPQLDPFKAHPDPVRAINTYLYHIWRESQERGYNFDKRKIGRKWTKRKMRAERASIKEEYQTLVDKLKVRDKKRYKALKGNRRIELHPSFVYG